MPRKLLQPVAGDLQCESFRLSQRGCITVTATRWKHGWELRMDADHVPQSCTLADAAQLIRDYLDTEYEDVDRGDWEVTVVPTIDVQRDVSKS